MISENPLLNGFEIKDKISTVVGFSQTFTQKRVSSFATNILKDFSGVFNLLGKF